MTTEDMSDDIMAKQRRAIELLAALAEAVRVGEEREKCSLGRVCQHPDCEEDYSSVCDNCDTRFCWEHGQRGGDRQVQDVGYVAYPAICWKCEERF